MNKLALSEDVLTAEARSISISSENAMGIERLGRQIAKAIGSGLFSQTKIRAVVLSSFLTDMVCDAFSACLLKRGIVAEIVRGPYGAIASELLSDPPRSRDCDIVVILPTHRDLVFAPKAGCSTEEADDAVEREAAFWADLWTRASKPIVQLAFDPPSARPLSEADGFRAGGRLRHVRNVNQRLADVAPPTVSLVDAEALAGRLGEQWHDARTYQLCKQPFGSAATPEVADTLAAAMAGLLGKAKKVLVLDLDNTLWGGVVGDVGVQGLVLGNETAEGEAFVAVQAYAKALSERGVILAVCSKNSEANARAPFKEHSGMVLSEDDIACFVANFDDKASNLRRVAHTLNVGLDALVFVDDNPVERAWVRQELPEVLVVDLPEDPALFCDAIEGVKAFPLHRLTAEDTQRNASYRLRAQVLQGQSVARDMSSFLRDLEPKAMLEAIKGANLDRVVQLLAKTNQFKLNRRLFSAEEVLGRGSGVFAVSFKDRLQNYGIVAVAVVEIRNEEAIILNWVMSCRVFARRLEHLTLELIREFASKSGAFRVIAPFTHSSKNRVAYDSLLELGFVDDGAGTMTTPVEPSQKPAPHFMEIEYID